MCQEEKIYFITKTFLAGNMTGSERCFPPTIAARVLRTKSMNPLAKPSLTQDPAEWLGDAHPLVAQLGTADGLASLHALAESLATRPVTSLEGLREFLRAYQERILLPHELPAIQRAFNHISRNEVRELIAFDQEL